MVAMSRSPEQAVPSRRTAIKRTPRPRDRKLQIVAAARQLFSEKGYAAVSADEIAGSVGITAGALYRHFDGKQDLLVHALIDALDAAAEGVRDEPSGDLEGVVRALTAVAGENRELGVLWSREIRLLDDAHRAVVRQHFFAVFGVVERRLARSRPELEPIQAELLTWSVLAVLTSVAFHRVPMTAGNVELLRGLATTVCRVPLASCSGAVAAPPAGLRPQARRELVLGRGAARGDHQIQLRRRDDEPGHAAGRPGHYPHCTDYQCAAYGGGVFPGHARAVQLYECVSAPACQCQYRRGIWLAYLYAKLPPCFGPAGDT